MTDHAYSQVAADQLDALETTADPALWNAIVDALELILEYPGRAQKMSGALTDNAGRIVFRIPVVGHPPYKVFWTSTATGAARIEAVFPHE